jgi:excisionase family DNA binding protein
MEQGLLTLDGAADFLKLKKSTIYKLSMLSKIPVVRITTRLRFRPSDLEAWIAAHTVPVGGRKNGKPSKVTTKAGR